MSAVTATRKATPNHLTRAAAYVRVSSRAQDDATQRSAIERAASGRGDVIEEWRAEERSASTMARKELQQLLADAKAGRLRGQRLYVFRLDRLTRSGIADTLTTLAAHMPRSSSPSWLGPRRWSGSRRRSASRRRASAWKARAGTGGVHGGWQVRRWPARSRYERRATPFET
jgi:Resolvase, N terminal domain